MELLNSALAFVSPYLLLPGTLMFSEIARSIKLITSFLFSLHPSIFNKACTNSDFVDYWDLGVVKIRI